MGMAKRSLDGQAAPTPTSSDRHLGPTLVDAAGATFPAVFLAAAHLRLLLLLAEEVLVGGTSIQHFICFSPDPSPVSKNNFFFFTGSADAVVGEIEKQEGN